MHFTNFEALLSKDVKFSNEFVTAKSVGGLVSGVITLRCDLWGEIKCPITYDLFVIITYDERYSAFLYVNRISPGPKGIIFHIDHCKMAVLMDYFTEEGGSSLEVMLFGVSIWQPALKIYMRYRKHRETAFS